MRRALQFLIVLTVLSMVGTAVLAQSNLPESIQNILDKINEANTADAQDFLMSVSYFIAFVAGIFSILSPCILPLLPAYFSMTFKERREITKMTLLFAVGFSVMFMLFGAAAGFAGERSLHALRKPWLIIIAGVVLLAMGVLSFLGKGFTSFVTNKGFRGGSTTDVLVGGFFFAAGWTACVGPILVGILSIAALLGEVTRAVIFMFFYSMGIFVPLFILAMFYDRLDLGKSAFMKGKSVTLWGREYNSTNVISGSLLGVVGLLFIVDSLTGKKLTAFINGMTVFGTSPFDSVQRWYMNWQHAEVVSILLMAVIMLLIALFLWSRRATGKRES